MIYSLITNLGLGIFIHHSPICLKVQMTGMDLDRLVGLVFIDLHFKVKKAFDTVDLEIVFKSESCHGLSLTYPCKNISAG